MSLRVVGAGLPRTGTSSLRDALGALLGGPVYHMSETMARPEHAAVWAAAIEGRAPDWRSFLAGYVAGVDAPVSNCWRELAAEYPDAVVLLSRRDSPATWYRSMAATVLPRTRQILARGDALSPLFRVLFSEVFTDPDDEAEAMAGYERWLETVRAEVPAGRLVEWQPGDGWEPLCAALGVDVPDRPFPHVNSTADYRARAAVREREGR